MNNRIDLKTPWHSRSLERNFRVPFDFIILDDEDNVVAGFKRNGGLTMNDCETLMKLVKQLPNMYDVLERTRNVLNGLMSMTDEEYHGARGMVDFAYGKLVADMDKVLDGIKEIENDERRTGETT